MPKECLHKKVVELEKLVNEQKAIIKELNRRLLNPVLEKSTYFSEIFSFDLLKDKFSNDSINLWFITLNYDPQFVKFNNIEDYYDFYETVVWKALDGKHIPVHGTYEFTKNGQLHLHFLIQYYDINELAGRLKCQLTHRPYLNYSVKVVKPSELKEFNGEKGVEGIYEYMSKTSNRKFRIKNI